MAENKKPIPTPTMNRLCALYQLLDSLRTRGVSHISSAQLGAMLGAGAHSIRKDLSILGDPGSSGARYNVQRLHAHLQEQLHLNRSRKVCVCGLGRLGTAMLNYRRMHIGDFSVVAGFESSINRLETLRTEIPLYPAHMIPDVVRRESIELGIITVPGDAAEATARRLIEGGIKGILNFAPVILSFPGENVHVTNMDVVRELRVLSAMIAMSEFEESDCK